MRPVFLCYLQDFTDGDEVKEWIIKNALGTRNLTEMQITDLRGRLKKARKNRKGYGRERDESGRYRKSQNDTYGDVAESIAKELGLARATINRAEEFVDGLDAAEAVVPGFRDDVLTGAVKAQKQEVAAMRKQTPDEIKKSVQSINAFGKLFGTLYGFTSYAYFFGDFCGCSVPVFCCVLTLSTLLFGVLICSCAANGVLSCLTHLSYGVLSLLIRKVPAPQLLLVHPLRCRPFVGEFHRFGSVLVFQQLPVLTDDFPAVVTIYDCVVPSDDRLIHFSIFKDVLPELLELIVCERGDFVTELRVNDKPFHHSTLTPAHTHHRQGGIKITAPP